MDLKSRYLGLELRTPLVASASPLSETIDGVKRLEDAGASAIVLSSLFEERLRRDRETILERLSSHTDSFAEAQSFLPALPDFHWGPEAYLEHIRRAKQAARVPIIASLNGATLGGWTAYARDIQSAGADALELNIYAIETDPEVSGDDVERAHEDILRAVKTATTLPVAVKLSPYVTSLPHLARRLVRAGAQGLVLFNRFYQPDFDLERMEPRPHLLLSTPQDLRLPLHWTAVLRGRVDASLAAGGGVHSGADALKLLLAGADATMLASALLKYGVEHLRVVEREMVRWLEEKEYASVDQLRGSMSQWKCADPSAFERAQYIRTLESYAAR